MSDISHGDKTRKTFAFDDEDLQQLAEVCGLLRSSETEAVRRSVRLMKELISASKNGAEISIIEPGKKPMLVRFF